MCKVKTKSIHAPLPSIPPLEGTVGCAGTTARQRKWEFEVGERMVTAQNRLGEILILEVPQVVEERTPGFATTYIRTYYNWTKGYEAGGGHRKRVQSLLSGASRPATVGPGRLPRPRHTRLSPGFTLTSGLTGRSKEGRGTRGEGIRGGVGTPI